MSNNTKINLTIVLAGGKLRVFLYNACFSDDAANTPASPAPPGAPTSTEIWAKSSTK